MAVTAVVRAPLLAAAMLGIVPALAAEGKFPARPMRMIVASSAGTGADIFARIVAQGLTEIYKEQVVVENRTGAGGLIGGVVAASATVGLLGREGITIRKTILPTIYYLVFTGLIALIAFYVIGVTDPLMRVS